MNDVIRMIIEEELRSDAKYRMDDDAVTLMKPD